MVASCDTDMLFSFKLPINEFHTDFKLSKNKQQETRYEVAQSQQAVLDLVCFCAVIMCR